MRLRIRHEPDEISTHTDQRRAHNDDRQKPHRDLVEGHGQVSGNLSPVLSYFGFVFYLHHGRYKLSLIVWATKVSMALDLRCRVDGSRFRLREYVRSYHPSGWGVEACRKDSRGCTVFLPGGRPRCSYGFSRGRRVKKLSRSLTLSFANNRTR